MYLNQHLSTIYCACSSVYIFRVRIVLERTGFYLRVSLWQSHKFGNTWTIYQKQPQSLFKYDKSEGKGRIFIYFIYLLYIHILYILYIYILNVEGCQNENKMWTLVICGEQDKLIIGIYFHFIWSVLLTTVLICNQMCDILTVENKTYAKCIK